MNGLEIIAGIRQSGRDAAVAFEKIGQVESAIQMLGVITACDKAEQKWEENSSPANRAEKKLTQARVQSVIEKFRRKEI